MNYDAIIIGGGASGLTCAIQLKRLNSSLSVLILERLSRVGKKLPLQVTADATFPTKIYLLADITEKIPNFVALLYQITAPPFVLTFFIVLVFPL